LEQTECEMYKKHHNIINGIYTLRMPRNWEEIPFIDELDAEDEDKELYKLFLDSEVYDIEDLSGFTSPMDEHNISETIFIIRRDGEYYLCETQGQNYIKFATKISRVDFIEQYDRSTKVMKLHEKSTDSRTVPDQQGSSENEHI
jgi:hypothetical protein